ncbi:hypothetical protein E2K93_16700 [Thalassotalea sp. HSM 43]|uniref:hypothetical protein n=1 Tax=Thalassotalea sp. HSM 43 TaxID=2552945 RepID=UPI001081ED65|nr:hypothetical protein [Thalassotalea sp. HSM 43]QBY05901.1 hypothetical protein E2K93_16700 [Thalassotalea sp. HSM 43]
MKYIKKLVGTGLLASTAMCTVSTAVANDLEAITSLPVITDDCGSTSCQDRRGLNVEQTLAVLSAATANERAAKAQAMAKMKDGDSGSNGSGLALGQLDNSTQVVFLNFEQSSDTFEAITFNPGVPETFNSHIYTQQERDAVQANIESRYQGFNMSFTQVEPSEGEYSTLNFECRDSDGICIDFGGGILFGRAQSIDIRNSLRDDSAFVDANLWQVLVQVDPSGAFFSRISGIEIIDGDVQGALSTAIVNQASNTGAHELGHNLGLRHHDSFGAPGDGVTPGTGDFFPVFDGPLVALESFDHTMASGASVGTGFTDSTVDLRFFSERSALKLAANQRPRLLQEAAVSGGNKTVKMRRVLAPNTLFDGENSAGQLELLEARVVGRIDEVDEVDSYRFNAKAGQFLSAELFGFDTPSAEQFATADFMIGAIALYYVEQDQSLTLVQQNFQNFEGYDAFMVDAPLAMDGEYILMVSAPDILLIPGFGFLSLDGSGNGDLRTGNYEVSMYVTNGRSGNGVSRVPGKNE